MEGPIIPVQIKINLQSAVGAAVLSEPFRLGANQFEMQLLGPAALFEIQGSNDLSNWAVLSNDNAGTPLTALGSGFFIAREEPIWLRVQIAADAGGPRPFEAIFNIGKVKG